VNQNALTQLITLCRELDTLNARNLNREGSVSIAPGRLANMQDVARRMLPELEKARGVQPSKEWALYMRPTGDGYYVRLIGHTNKPVVNGNPVGIWMIDRWVANDDIPAITQEVLDAVCTTRPSKVVVS